MGKQVELTPADGWLNISVPTSTGAKRFKAGIPLSTDRKLDSKILEGYATHMAKEEGRKESEGDKYVAKEFTVTVTATVYVGGSDSDDYDIEF